jgi:sugar lactone lactonase YvrE
VGPQTLFQPGTQSVLGAGSGQPVNLALDGNGNLYVSFNNSTALSEMLAVDGTIPASPTIKTIASGLNAFGPVAMDGSGNLFLGAVDSKNALQEVLAVNGSIPASPTIRTLCCGFSMVSGIAVDGSGSVYITEANNTVLKLWAVNGSVPASPGVETLGSGFNEPGGIAVDASGNVYVADTGNRAVKEILAVNGIIPPTSPTIRTLGSGFVSPQSIAVDGNGNVFVGDPGISSVKEILAVNGSIPASPTIITLGSGILFPIDVTVDGSGNVYVADFASKQVVRLDYADPPSLAFASTAVGATSTDSPQTITVVNAGNAALNFPIPATGSNPSIGSNFTWNSSGASACPLVTGNSWTYGTLAAGSSCQLPISFTPTVAGTVSSSLVLTDNDLNAAAPGYINQTIALSGVGTQATPTFAWAAPVAIPYGTALSAVQLNATSTVAGTFTYSPAAGTVLTAGSQTLTATFTPTDTTDYTTATQTVSITVTQATPTIAWATPAAIPYGTALSATQLDASSTVAGTLSYSPAAGTLLTAGSQTLTATFTPTDTVDYTTATATVNLTVTKATPTISWATPAAIPYGTALSATQLDASSTVAGTLSYSPAAGTLLTAGSQTLTATFMPTDTVDYTTATASVNLTVTKATPTISWATPTAIPYGTALSATQLDATSNVAGTFTYSPAAGTVLAAGSQTLTTTFTPTDTVDYTTATASVNLAVNKAAPTITWVTPAAIAYGTALSATQLDATSNVAGTFTYSPAAGTVLAAGSQTLTTTFTPTDTVDYTTATATVVLTVNPAPSFTLGASPTSLTVVQGSSGTSTLTVTKLNGFTGSVTLAASGLPSGVTATFGTNPTTGTSVLTLKASSSATLGSAPVTIKGTSGSLTASTTIALTISCSPTPIVPYIYVNSAWTEESSVTVSSPTTVVDLGPQPSSGGTWNWSGPNGYSSTSRQINSIPLTVGTDSYLATYTNSSGCKSAQTFTITVK